MKYALLIYESPEDFAARTADSAPDYWAAWQSYTQTLAQSGHMTGGSGLQGPETATTVAVAGGKRTIQDGPFADSKEQLGGFYLIDVPSLDEAIEWAARVPVSERGRVEIRPELMMQDGTQTA